MTGFCSSPCFADHVTGPHHPERPDRIRAVWRAVRDTGLLDLPNPWPDFPPEFPLGRQVSVGLPDRGPPDPAPDGALLRSPPPQYLERLRRVCGAGGGVLDLGDTPVGRESGEVAQLA